MNTEAAKQLLKKAIALNDPELIELANQALGEATTRFKCLKCGKFFHEARKSCPECRGRKIEVWSEGISNENVEVEVTPTKSSHPFGKVDLAKMAKMLKDIPTEGDASKDILVRDKLKSGQMHISSRRPEAIPVDVVCNKCNKKYQVPQKLASKYYVCVKCVKV